MHPERIGPYLIDRKIGSGGMGNVYLGRQETTGLEAAVKVLPASLAREEGFVLRFTREVEALRKLRHPNIVSLYDSGVDGETYYYAMEYVDGDTLTQRIRREKRIPWRDAVEMTIQICGALKAAHDAGVIHRDLKPSNLMIAAEGTVKLTDFGVAQVFATAKLTVTGGVIGTAEYMSPEQSQGQRATKRSDLYSLGAVLYVMLTGRPPFTGATTVEIIQKQRFGRFDRPKLYVPDIPSWLDDLVGQLLEKDPDKRPPDAYVLSRKLQEILGKVELSRRDDRATVVEGHLTIEDATPEAQAADPAVGATLMRDLIRGEIDRQQTPGPIQNALNNVWVLIALLTVLVGGIAWRMQRRPLTPDEQFQAGLKLLQKPAGDDWLEARQRYLLPLVQADPERWAEKVRPYLEEIEGYELESTKTPPRVRGKQKAVRSEPDRMLERIRGDWERGDYAAAEAKLSALSALLDGDPDLGPIRAVVETWRTSLADLQQSLPDRRAFVESVLTRAETLRDSNPDQARSMAQGLLALYRDDPTVDDLLERARQMAATMTEDSPP